MHRHVRGVGDKRPVAVEHRAREIEPLLDVYRVGGVLQRHAHLLGDRHEQIVEYFEHHRIGAGADGAGTGELLDPPQHQMILGGKLGPPARLDDDRLVRLDDDGGAVHLLSGREGATHVDERPPPFAAGEEPRAARRRRQRCPRGLVHAFAEACAAADGLDGDRLDDQFLAAVDEAEASSMRALEGGLHIAERDELCLPSPLWGGVGDEGS